MIGVSTDGSMTLGQYIKGLRRSRFLQVSDVAKVTGNRHEEIEALEDGSCTYRAANVFKVLDTLRVPYDKRGSLLTLYPGQPCQAEFRVWTKTRVGVSNGR